MKPWDRFSKNYEIAKKHIKVDCAGDIKEFEHRVEVMAEIAQHCGYDLSVKSDFENCESLFTSISEIINRFNPYSF